MNAIFLFNNQKEDVSRYLTRAARWIDVIRNGAHYEDAECCLVERMTEEEHKEIINYVFSVMEPTIKEISKYCINLWKMYDIEDDFYNQACMEIFRNFHKYNNPAHNNAERTYAFATFVQTYMKDPARVARRHHRGFSKRLDDRRRQISRAKEFIAARDKKAYGDITLEELYEAIPQISKVPMSMKLLKRTVELTSFVKNFDDNEMVATYEDELTFMDPVYEEIIVGFIAKLRPIERFIFLQNYEYCADKYVHLTTKELGSVREFVELCKQDKFGKKHICWEGCRECVEDKFIRNQRDSVRNRFRDTILKADMNAEDLSGKLEELMMREWHKLEKEMN